MCFFYIFVYLATEITLLVYGFSFCSLDFTLWFVWSWSPINIIAAPELRQTFLHCLKGLRDSIDCSNILLRVWLSIALSAMQSRNNELCQHSEKIQDLATLHSEVTYKVHILTHFWSRLLKKKISHHRSRWFLRRNASQIWLPLSMLFFFLLQWTKKSHYR